MLFIYNGFIMAETDGDMNKKDYNDFYTGH